MYEEIELVGRLTADPTMRLTPNGIPVTSFTVATTKKLSKTATPSCPEGWKDGYQGKAWELTKFFRVTCWRGLAETCDQYLAKGRMVFVKGELNGEAVDGIQNPRIWSGSDGTPRASYEITARIVRFLDAANGNGHGNGNGNGSGGYSQDAPPPGYGDDLSDVPF
jgi:single-strand DNA-binding protein